MLIVTRKMELGKFVFRIENLTSVYGEASYTAGFIPRKIKVSGENGNTLKLIQTNWVLRILNSLPVFNIFRFVPYRYYIDDIYMGRFKITPFKRGSYFIFGDDIFELQGHSKNYISLMKNNSQVALYKKDIATFMEENRYTIKYDDRISIQLLLLFCIFIDVESYPNHLRISASKYEVDFAIKDPYKERTHWEPDTISLL